MSTDAFRLHAQVFGRVQGVYFRGHTQTQAQALGLTGWVRNCADGSVEVLAEGSRATLEQLLAFLQRGPAAAAVIRVVPTWGTATGEFVAFEVQW